MSSDLDELLRGMSRALGGEVAVWVADGDAISGYAGSTGSLSPPDPALLPRGDDAAFIEHPSGSVCVAALPPPAHGWLAVGPVSGGAIDLPAMVRLLAPLVARQLQSMLEVDHAARELAERYEEINLLYTISEILGRTLTLEDAASTILTEIAETVGARRGAILVHDSQSDSLRVVASTALGDDELMPVDISADDSASAHVFRARHPLIVGDGELLHPAEQPYRRGQMLSVPIQWTAPRGPETLGVVNLSDRRSRQPFTAGDLKLVAAIATQIGTAIQNARLVSESLSQQRLMQEMEHAHDLQMRLLPNPAVVAPTATVAARVVPAESVAGDFYQLFPLGEDRVGIMLGDVSSHGYRAALIMALAMSASAIHAQATADPAAVLAAVLESLHEELQTTEMFISLFYCVIDRGAGELRYANAGHPHAFVVGEDGAVRRLAATDPPLGMVDFPPTGVRLEWRPGDMLALFTDGVCDVRNADDVRLGEEAVVHELVEARSEPPHAVVDRVTELVADYAGGADQRDDLTIVVART